MNVEVGDLKVLAEALGEKVSSQLIFTPSSALTQDQKDALDQARRDAMPNYLLSTIASTLGAMLTYQVTGKRSKVLSIVIRVIHGINYNIDVEKRARSILASK